MENVALKMAMITKYHELAFTDKYILGFNFKKNVYIAYVSGAEMVQYIKLDKASRGAGYSIRFRPNTAEKYALLASATLLCSVDFFNAEYEASVYNRGEILEKLVTEMVAGQVWEKDSVPFTEAGDVNMDGIAYQIKYEDATFTNEKTLANLMAKTGR